MRAESAGFDSLAQNLLLVALSPFKIFKMKRICPRLLVLIAAALVFISPAVAVNVVDPGKNNGTPDAATVKKAVSEFRNLSKKERKDRIKLVKKTLKDFKAEKKRGAEPSTNTILLAVLAILLPPLAVYLHEGTTNNKFWISVLLTLLFWVPGVIYALIVVLS